MNSFFNNSIEAIEEPVDELQTGEFFRGIQSRKFLKERHIQHRVEREAGKACAILMHEQTTIPQMQLARAISKITEFVDCMDGLFSLDDDSLFLDTSDEECVSVKFKRDRNMSLDIYFDEEEDLVNEAYLCFMVKGKLRIMNDSIPNIAVVIKDLLY